MEERRRETAGSQAPQASSSSASAASARPVENLPPPPETTPGSSRRLKRKASHFNSSSSSSKRLAREKANASLLPPIHNGPLTRARQLSDNAAYSSALNAVRNEGSVASAAQGDAAGGSQGYDDALDKEYEALEASIEVEFQRIQTRDSNVHVVPVPSGWYSWTTIHPIEEQALPSFFSGKSENRTPETYMGIRNWIMRKFHANPNTNVELKDLSYLSIGELNARQEVLEFLEVWGLINYHPFPAKDICKNSGNDDAKVNQDVKNNLLIEQLYRFEMEKSATLQAPKTNLSTPAMPVGWFRESALAEELVKQEGPAVEYHCNSCAADCSRKRYHCQKQADFDLCSECYSSGKFGADMSPLDFILMEPGEAGASGGKWTDQETLLLLEALELFKENWNEIAEHVATKTKAQCILHFLQMPIEDSFLDNDAEVKVSSQENDPSMCKNAPEAPKVPEDPTSVNDDSSAAKEDQDGSKSQTSTEVQPVPMETPNSEAIQDEKADAEASDDIARTALKQAFDLVGSPLTDEDKLSFSGAGNHIMTLTTFLAHLVDPESTTASARCALKSMSGKSNSSVGLQLASRHCFVMEDPPDDKKDHTVSDSMDTETTEQGACKDEIQDNKIQKDTNHDEEKDLNESEENPTDRKEEKPSKEGEEKNGNQSEESPQNQDGQKSIDGTHETDDLDIDKTKHSALDENPSVASQVEDGCIEKSKASEENEELSNHKQHDSLNVVNAQEITDSTKEQRMNDVNKSEDSSLCLKPTPNSVQKSEDGDVVAATQCVKSQKDVEMEPTQCLEEPKDIDRDLNHSAELPKDIDMVPTDHCAEATQNEDTEQFQKKLEDQGPDAVAEGDGDGAKTGTDKVEDAKNGDIKSTDTKDDQKLDKLKRAAVTALTAAAVKAKLLADQEEEEIRQLAVLLIDKQLRKLEVKLSFFSEMDNAVMRLREQLERSRQKLYHERAQIIADRLSSRMMPSALPANRTGMNLANSMPRPAMNLASHRPSIPRPGMTLGPPTSNLSNPSAVGGGSSSQPSGQ